MGIVRQAYITSDEFDFASTREENVRFGFVLDLPFRIRLGDLYRHSFSFRGKAFEVVLHNKYSIPPGTTYEQVFRDRRSYSDLWSSVLVIVSQPQVSPEALDAVRRWVPKEGETPPIGGHGSTFAAMEALNNFLVAYATGAKQLFGGKPLRLLTTNDLMDLERWEITILCDPNEELSDDDCLGAFNIKVDRHFVSSGAITGHLDDLPIAATRISIDEHLQLQESFMHHKLAFEAKSKMVIGDYIGALLLAVAALEGAHAVFVQQELTQRLPETERDLPEEFMRELGMSLCNRLTPYLLMNKEERPSHEVVMQAGHGLKIRNEIMHSLRNRKGQYRVETRSNKAISEAYSAVLGLYEKYLSALAARSKKEGAQQ